MASILEATICNGTPSNLTGHHSSKLLAVGSLILVMNGCLGAEVSSAGAVVRDSAGIQLIDNEQGIWDASTRWTVADSPILTIGSILGSPDREFRDIVSAGYLSDGRIFVADGGTWNIRIFDREGRLLNVAGRNGSGPGEFQFLQKAWRGAADSIFVYDPQFRRISVFSAEGILAREVSLTPNIAGFMSLAAPRAGGWLSFVDVRPAWTPAYRGEIAQSTTHLVLFDNEGNEIRPLPLAPGNEWRLGQRGATLPLYAYRAVGSVGDDGIRFGLPGSGGIGVFSLEGELHTIIRHSPQKPTITPQEYQKAIEAAVESASPSAREETRQRLTSFPVVSSLPPFGRMQLDQESNLWVSEFAPQPQDPRTWTVYRQDGRLLGQVEMPARFFPLSITAEEVIGRYRDEMDAQHLWVLPLRKF